MVASSNTEPGAYDRGNGDMEGFVRGDDRLTKAFHTVRRQADFEAGEKRLWLTQERLGWNTKIRSGTKLWATALSEPSSSPRTSSALGWLGWPAEPGAWERKRWLTGCLGIAG